MATKAPKAPKKAPKIVKPDNMNAVQLQLAVDELGMVKNKWNNEASLSFKLKSFKELSAELTKRDVEGNAHLHLLGDVCKALESKHVDVEAGQTYVIHAKGSVAHYFSLSK